MDGEKCVAIPAAAAAGTARATCPANAVGCMQKAATHTNLVMPAKAALKHLCLMQILPHAVTQVAQRAMKCKHKPQNHARYVS
jgi:hypothetical protein